MFINKHINNSKIGNAGENIACEYITRKGWRIIARNHRERSDEIDIIAIASDGTLVFCEVKSLVLKSGPLEYGFMPEENLTSNKLRKISRACRIFAGKHPELIDDERGWRIDLIAIDMGSDAKGKNLRHYENV